MVDEKETAGLEALGLSEGEATAYACLLAASGGSAADVAQAVGVTARRAAAILDSLEANGLASRSVSDDQRFVPAPARNALDILSQRREQQLHDARQHAIRFLERVAEPTGSRPDRDFLHVVVGAEAIGERFQHMVLGAKSEIIAFTAAPMSHPGEEWTKAKIALLESGVRGRVIYDLASLQAPGAIDFIRQVAFGEEARTLPTLPLPLVIIDRQAAILPLTSETPGPDSEVLIVYESSLLDLLLLLFEAVWDRAAPFDTRTGRPRRRRAGPDLSDEDRKLLSLMGAGMKEVAVAHHLGVGRRTVERRLSIITEKLGTTSRFHTGVEAHRRGWTGEGAEDE